jgi:hypothetical protein
MPATSAVVTALVGPKVLPTNVMKSPVDGVTLANSERVFARKAIATSASRIVSGEAIPAVVARNPKPK